MINFVVASTYRWGRNFERLVGFSIFYIKKSKNKQIWLLYKNNISVYSQIKLPIELEACIYYIMMVNTMWFTLNMLQFICKLYESFDCGIIINSSLTATHS